MGSQSWAAVLDSNDVIIVIVLVASIAVGAETQPSYTVAQGLDGVDDHVFWDMPDRTWEVRHDTTIVQIHLPLLQQNALLDASRTANGATVDVIIWKEVVMSLHRRKVDTIPARCVRQARDETPDFIHDEYCLRVRRLRINLGFLGCLCVVVGLLLPGQGKQVVQQTLTENGGFCGVLLEDDDGCKFDTARESSLRGRSVAASLSPRTAPEIRTRPELSGDGLVLGHSSQTL